MSMATNKEVSTYLQLRRFRRRLKSKQKQKARRKAKQKALLREKAIRHQGKLIHNSSEALSYFMTRHFLHLITAEKSPFCQDKLENKGIQKRNVIRIPENFSILSNPEPSYKVLKQLVEAIAYQNCEELSLDYQNCTNCDLATQVFLDSILKSFDKYIRLCKVAGITQFIRIGKVGGEHIHNSSLQKMINSVGSPVELINRRMQYKDVEPFRLRLVDSRDVTKIRFAGQKEIDATDLIEYVERCLSRFNKTLTQDARQALGTVLGETLANAEEHSTLHNRYLIGYMEETSDNQSHYGLLNVVIMNTGSTIYERFKYPDEDEKINMECVKQMKTLSEKFTNKGFFDFNIFTEENLWTLYSLQGGVSIVPREVRNRGNGTIGFIKSFFSLKGSTEVDNISRMTILSGNTRIDFDGTYQISESFGADGRKIERMTFNKSNSLEDKPDSKYVYNTEHYFPGTLISAQLLINDDDVQKI